MYTSTVVDVLISSPSDVPDARDAIQQEISQWNMTNSRRRGVSAVAVRWETHAVPEMGDHPQQILNRQLVDQCDLLVAVFGTRLGTPTPNGRSGTAEEIERFIASRKPVLLYRVTGRERPDTDQAQLRALEEFLVSLRQRGLLAECDGIERLRADFRRHVSEILANFEPEKRLPPAKLNEFEIKLLVHLGENGRTNVGELSQGLDVGAERLLFHFERLGNAGFVEQLYNAMDGESYVLTRDGRAELFDRGLLH